MGVIPISVQILEASQLAKQVKETLDKPIPSPSGDLTRRERWQQCTVKNATQFPLVMDQTYFDSGRYWSSPGNIPPFDQGVFSFCNRDGMPSFKSPGGANAWQLQLDKDNSFAIAMGWVASAQRSARAGVTESDDPKEGFNSASSGGNSIVSRNEYEGKTTGDDSVKITFHISAQPGQEALFIVTQML